MKAIVAVLLGLAILAGGFGVYRWVSGDDDDRGRAESAAQELTEWCRNSGGQCDVTRVEPISDGFWRFHIRDPVGGSRCTAVDLEHFRASATDSIYVGGTVEGIADAACSPEWWMSDDAVRRLRNSAWAAKRKAAVISCSGRGGSPGRSWYFRRFRCRYSSASGDRFVNIETTGSDTFEIKSGS